MIPVLWRSGGIVVQTHDVFSLLAVAIGLAIYYRSLRAAGMLEPRIIIASSAVVVGGVIGARIITAWEHPTFYADSIAAGAPVSWIVEHSGKSILGALAGGYVAGVAAKRALRYTTSTADHYALALAVATAIGRIGCYLSELPLGTSTDLPWGVAVSPAVAASFARCPGCELPMHPSMLYEVLFSVVAAAAILRWRSRVPVRGDVLRLYLLAACSFRFLVEFVRGNQVEAFGLTGPQLVVIPMVAVLVAHFVREARARTWEVPAAPAARPGVGPVQTRPPSTAPFDPSWRVT